MIEPGVITYEATGVLRETLAGGHKAVIAHEPIPGYMEAMTMEFDAPEARDLAGLEPGDTIAFRLSVTDKHGWIDHVRRTGHVAFAPPAASEAAPALDSGAMLPECSLVDERGLRIRLADFRGGALAITFIYTRCPFPDFCPLMSDRFREVQRALAAEGAGGKWRLLSVTIDPQHDTPQRLSEYARGFQADPSHWSFATGDAEEIQKLSGLFGIAVIREGAQLNHNLRTVVVDAAGRVHKIFTGNAWSAGELIKAMNSSSAPPP